MPQLRVLLGFTNAPDHSVQETALAILDNLWGNPAYAAVPFPATTLQAALTAFNTAIGDASQGGTAATAAKNNARDAVVALLRQLAGYVQEACDNDLAALLSSGFDAVSTNRASTPLPAPTILSLDNGNSGQLFVRVTPVKNTKCYEVRYAAVPPGGVPAPWQSGGLFTNSRGMPINGLTPGTTYTVQARAIGGSTGYSDWSNPTSHMSL